LIDKALVGLQRLPRDGGALGSPPDLEQLRMLVHEVTRIVDDLQRGGPRTLVVASDGTAPYRQIASANGIARPGDTILLKPGVYKEPENIALGPGVSLVGENAATVIVDGGGRGWVLRAADNCEIAHLTIRGSGAATGVNDCGVMIDGCKGVRVHHNVVSKNRHYGIIVRNAEASIHDNVIADNRILGIYADEGAVLDVVRNVFHRHRHSALDIQARNARGRFHRNTVVACGNGLLYGSSLDRPLDVEVFDNIFMDQESGVSAPGIWSSRVDHNLFFRVENAYYDSERSRAVELDGSNRQADPRLVPGSFALAADSPAIGAARDGGDLGAFPFDEHAARRPPPAKADEHPQARRRVKRTGAKGGVKKRKAKSQVEKPPAKQSSSGARRATSSNRKRQRSTRKERRSSRKK
jgi:hypothetical protein